MSELLNLYYTLFKYISIKKGVFLNYLKIAITFLSNKNLFYAILCDQKLGISYLSISIMSNTHPCHITGDIKRLKSNAGSNSKWLKWMIIQDCSDFCDLFICSSRFRTKTQLSQYSFKKSINGNHKHMYF